MFLLAALWTLWCILHSLLITGAVNNWLRKKGGFPAGVYRLFYIVFSCVTLIPILWYQYTLPQHHLFSWSGPWRILQGILLIYAFIMFYGGKQVYDISFFLGLSQWRSYHDQTPVTTLPFSRKGILNVVRHPWYSGGLAFLWGIHPFTNITLMVKCILSLYLIIGTLLEEHKLRHELGSTYLKYCQQVPMLIPWKVFSQLKIK